MKKKKKNVQNVETKTQENDSPVVATQDVSQDQTETADATPMPFDLSAIDPEKVKMAEDLGIPIGQIITWAASVEQRFHSIEQNLADAPEKVVAALKAEALKGQEAMAQQTQQQGSKSQQGGGSGTTEMLLRILAGGGGGGGDPVMQMYQKEILQAGLESARMGTAFQKALVIKLVPSFAEDILKGISVVPKSE